jgi:hypothetical protein
MLYMGARYNNTELGIEISTEPEWQDFPSITPYAVNLNNPIMYVDENGDSPTLVTAAVGAGVGALVGGGIEMFSQWRKNGKITNWRAVAGSAAGGAVTGGMAGLTLGASVAATAVGVGLASAAGGVTNDMVQGNQSTVGSVATNFAVGALGGLAFQYAGNAVSKLINYSNGGKIITSGVTHGTQAHWNTITSIGAQAAKRGETAYLNKALSTSLGRNDLGNIGGLKPDVVSIGKNGTINITEVQSPSQTPKELFQKLDFMKTQLTKLGYKVNTQLRSETGSIVNQ